MQIPRSCGETKRVSVPFDTPSTTVITSLHPRIFKAATTQNDAQVNGRNSVCEVITKLPPLNLPKSAPMPRALHSSSDSRETQQKCSDARSTAWPAIEVASKIERAVRFILLRCIEVMLVCRWGGMACQTNTPPSCATAWLEKGWKALVYTNL